MKKSLVKKLARMAKDGDPEAIEAVTELLEEISENELSESAETIAAAAEEPAAVIETPEATVVVDEATLDEILSRLDRIISLLTPSAGDESAADPAEEITEAVEEVLEAVAAEAESASDPVGSTPGEISALLEAIVEPVLPGEIPEVLQPEEDACDPEQEVLSAGDALRAALSVVRPVLASMPRQQRKRLCADISARLKKSASRAADAGIYSALASVRRKPAANSADLGRRIMERRNPNYRK